MKSSASRVWVTSLRGVRGPCDRADRTRGRFQRATVMIGQGSAGQTADLDFCSSDGCSRWRVGWCGVWTLLPVLLGGCGPDLIDLDLAGSVTDQSTGEPIAGAPVLLTWSRGFADLDAVGTESGADGGYRLLVFRFPCEAPALTTGLDPYEAETVDVRCVQTPQTVDFQLTAGGFR